MNKKAFTLTELIISITFIAIIFTAAISIWSVSGKVFKDTGRGSSVYHDARAFETMLINAASVAPDFIFESTQPGGLDPVEALDYFAFFYDEIQESFAVKYTVANGNGDGLMEISYKALASKEDVRIGLRDVRSKPGSSMLETRYILQYEIGRNEDGSPVIIGAVALTDLRAKNFSSNNVIPSAYRNQVQALNDEILYLEWGDLDE